MHTPRDSSPSETPGGHTESVDAYPEDDEAVPRRPEALPAGARIADRYTVASVLGTGGYAVVHLARDERTGADVALKVLRADRLGPAALKRMAREAETARRFDHPGLVRVLDHGREGDHAFLAMEVVRGATLRERLKAGHLTTDEAVRIAIEILSALAVLHREGIVHRDVKPSNILLDGEGHAKLGDFGLVTRSTEDQTRATQSQAIVGTLEYVSPEQALGEKLDGRSDLYAVGVVLYEMLSGAPLHGARSSLGMLVAHLTKPAPDIRASRDSVPEWLAAVVARLLAKSRDERYANADDVIADLEDRVAPARTESMPRQTRPRAAVGAVALIAIAALAVGWRMAGPRPAPSIAPILSGAEVKGGVLRALDEKGAVAWTHRFATPLDDASFTSTALLLAPRLRIADLDGDGSNEVLIAAFDAEGAGSVVAFNADGSVRFNRKPGRAVIYGTTEYAEYIPGSIYFYVDRHGKRRRFVLATHRQWFPSVLEELDDRGRVVSEYFASGHQASVSRLTFKGEDALALSGYHNETRGGSVTFLSLDHPSGRAPAADPQYGCTTCPAKDPMAILLLPRTDVVVALNGPEGSAHATMARAFDKGLIDVNGDQVEFADVDGQVRAATVGYTFTPDLSRLLDVRVSELLRRVHDRFFREGRLDHAWDARDEASARRVRTWDGKGWAPVPLDGKVTGPLR